MMSYEQRLDNIVAFLVTYLKIKAPKDTGNLAVNGIKKVWDSKHQTWVIVIGGELAPYAVYTNEPWTTRSGRNPNEAWIQKALEEAKPTVRAIMAGALTERDLQQLRMETRDNFASQMEGLS